MKKKKSGGGGANWMDTYGDMVTLLLCFFVMLYSMSTLDKEKWIALVQSFNPTEEVTETQPPSASGGEGTGTQEDIDQDMEELSGDAGLCPTGWNGQSGDPGRRKRLRLYLL